jgi:hypothetical protein
MHPTIEVQANGKEFEVPYMFKESLKSPIMLPLQLEDESLDHPIMS